MWPISLFRRAVRNRTLESPSNPSDQIQDLMFTWCCFGGVVESPELLRVVIQLFNPSDPYNHVQYLIRYSGTNLEARQIASYRIGPIERNYQNTRPETSPKS